MRALLLALLLASALAAPTSARADWWNTVSPAFAAAGGKPSALTLVPLDVATVTTANTAVVALAAGKRTAGGWIFNPSTTTALCIAEIGTAATSSSGNTTCIAAGATYWIAPAAGAVSVVATDSAHVFSGMGLQ